MRSILKALGLSIWSAIAILASVIFVLVAFQVAMKYRAFSALDYEKELDGPSNESQAGESAASVALPAREPDLRVPEIAPRAAEVTDCEKARGILRIPLDSPQRARLAHLLDTSDAAKADSGDAFVRLGQVYFGFKEYELAIAAIERGLEKGHVAHLAEAYVYLGRSDVAVGDVDAARDAFGKLKDVPDMSPRVLELWTLYAEMLPKDLKPATVVAEECRAQ